MYYNIALQMQFQCYKVNTAHFSFDPSMYVLLFNTV